ncbi:MAG: glycosyltransferase [Fimbriimonadales bacterium]
MICVVVCSASEERAEAFRKHVDEVMAGDEYELVSILRPRSLASGYNEGLARSKGNPVVFCHDDIEFLGADVPKRIRRHLENFDGIGVAGTDKLIGPGWAGAGPPHLFGQIAHAMPNGGYSVVIFGISGLVAPHMQAMDGLFLAFRRDVIESIGWDSDVFDGFHLYDIDTCFRAYKGGCNLAVVNDIPLAHASGGTYDDKLQVYADRFMRKSGSELPPAVVRRGTFSSVQVATKAEALEVMSPRWLGDIQT